MTNDSLVTEKSRSIISKSNSVDSFTLGKFVEDGFITEEEVDSENESLIWLLGKSVTFVLIAALTFIISFIWSMCKATFCFRKKKNFNVASVQQTLSQAVSYDQWRTAAEQLDIAQGKDDWKQQKESLWYDYKLIEHRLNNFRVLGGSDDTHALINALREGLVRNLGGISQSIMFEYCNFGSKKLIAEYTNEVEKQLHKVANSDIEGFSLEKKIDFFYEVRQSYGRTALLLSGGASLGMYHTGVIRALYEANLLPRVISGSSVGSIAASFLCILKEDELPKLFELSRWNLDVFEGSGSLRRKLARLLRKGVLMDSKKLQSWLRKNFGDLTFKEAFERTGKILNISVSSTVHYEFPRLLNYLTSPNVLIWSAVTASCALPFVFSPVELMAKDKNGKIVPYLPLGQKWSDGSVDSDLPMNRLSELFNVNYFIVSQVNPHVAPFLYINQSQKGVTAAFLYLVKSEIKHRITQLHDLGLIPRFLSKFRPIVTQKYSGDITIVPQVTLVDLTRILSNPTEEIMGEYMLKGQRGTWPRIEMIRHQCTIEFTVERILENLRKKQIQQAQLLAERPVVLYSCT